MKALENHIIIYDDECPMCKVYTRAFVQAGMLDENGRTSYSNMVEKERTASVDWSKARNEIALLNTKNGTAIYGIDSLLEVLGYNYPALKLIFRQSLLGFPLQGLYFLISFNRKVIAPDKVFEGKNKCTPDMNLPYRWAYIIFCWLVTSIVLTSYSATLIPLLPPTTSLREFLICGGQLVSQGMMVWLIHKERSIHYLGNMMTVSLIGALLLIPALILSHWISGPWFYAGYFMLVVGMMFREHWRRVKILELPACLSATWVLYRLLILAFIFGF